MHAAPHWISRPRKILHETPRKILHSRVSCRHEKRFPMSLARRPIRTHLHASVDLANRHKGTVTILVAPQHCEHRSGTRRRRPSMRAQWPPSVSIQPIRVPTLNSVPRVSLPVSHLDCMRSSSERSTANADARYGAKTFLRNRHERSSSLPARLVRPHESANPAQATRPWAPPHQRVSGSSCGRPSPMWLVSTVHVRH